MPKPKYSIDTISPKGKVLGVYKIRGKYEYLVEGHLRLIKENNLNKES